MYRIKDIIYFSLQFYTRQLQSLQHVQPPQPQREDITISMLCRLLPLYEHILREEYTDVRTSITTLMDTRTAELSRGFDHNHITCDFCGADVFQAFFECTKRSNSSQTGAVSEAVIVCPMCYVEGRTCICGIMRAAQKRPYASLLSARNEAVAVLNTSARCKTEDLPSPALWDESVLRSPLRPRLDDAGSVMEPTVCPVFHASMILLQERKNIAHKVCCSP